MVYRRKEVAKALNYASSALGIVSSFGLGHAVKGIRAPEVCTTIAQLSPGLYSSVCGVAQTVANVFTNAGVNATVTAFECVPFLNLDTQLSAACLAPLPGLVGLSLVGLITAGLLKRHALKVKRQAY